LIKLLLIRDLQNRRPITNLLALASVDSKDSRKFLTEIIWLLKVQSSHSTMKKKEVEISKRCLD
jgi:hypothetical protein